MSWQQLAAAVALISFFSLLTFSRRSPFPLQPVLTVGTTFFVMFTTLLNYLLMTVTWPPSQGVFHNTSAGAIPRIIQLGGGFLAIIALISGVWSLMGFRDYALRQRISYLVAALVLCLGCGFLSLCPQRLQRMLDPISTVSHPVPQPPAPA